MLGCAYIWIWLGFGNYQDAPVQRPDVIYLLLSPDTRALMWIIPAIIAGCTAFSRRGSLLGLAALAIPPAIVVASFGYAWALYLIPGGAEGFKTAYYSAAIFGSTLGMVIYVAFQKPAAKKPREVLIT